MFQRYIAQLEAHLKNVRSELNLGRIKEAKISLKKACNLLDESHKFNFEIELSCRSGKREPSRQMKAAFLNYYSLIKQMHFIEISQCFKNCEHFILHRDLYHATEYYYRAVQGMNHLRELYTYVEANGLVKMQAFKRFSREFAKLQHNSWELAKTLECHSPYPEDKLAIRLVENITNFNSSQSGLGLNCVSKANNSPGQNRYSQFGSHTPSRGFNESNSNENSTLNRL